MAKARWLGGLSNVRADLSLRRFGTNFAGCGNSLSSPNRKILSTFANLLHDAALDKFNHSSHAQRPEVRLPNDDSLS